MGQLGGYERRSWMAHVMRDRQQQKTKAPSSSQAGGAAIFNLPFLHTVSLFVQTSQVPQRRAVIFR